MRCFDSSVGGLSSSCLLAIALAGSLVHCPAAGAQPQAMPFSTRVEPVTAAAPTSHARITGAVPLADPADAGPLYEVARRPETDSSLAVASGSGLTPDSFEPEAAESGLPSATAVPLYPSTPAGLGELPAGGVAWRPDDYRQACLSGSTCYGGVCTLGGQGGPGGVGALGAGGGYADYSGCYTWQLLPDTLLFKSYLASGRESRFQSNWFYEKDMGWLWDVTLGGRVGIVRYGTSDPTWPEGWQLDIEGAAFPRLDLEEHRDVVSTDFRFGVPLTWRKGPWEAKFAYYHLSSHMGDEYMVKYPRPRINYSRDVLVLAAGYYPYPDLRLYAEAGWGYFTDDGARPWEFQFGADYSPLGPSGLRGAPFAAVNGRIRQEVSYGGNVTAQIGWQWAGRTGHLFRLGYQYFNGKSDQYQFFRESEEQHGLALWYDY